MAEERGCKSEARSEKKHWSEVWRYKNGGGYRTASETRRRPAQFQGRRKVVRGGVSL